MTICEALDVTPDWLLSGIDAAASRENGRDYYTIKKDTEMGRLIAYYNRLQPMLRERVMGYVEAYSGLDEKNGKKED